ncbi:MAG TPA: carboxypeptidase-like regulatory domain-containing protein [Pyrinomonadaceae bacterium]|nr:carboxypeptidase-like regulatory domain-containing protein [Pyrinomonadaceae bacterium]
MSRAFRSSDRKKSFAAVILVFPFITLGCDGATSVTGNIMDEDGKPVAVAVVMLEVDGRKEERRSNAAGYYEIGLTHAPFKSKAKPAVSKTGYQSFEQEFESQLEIGRERDIILLKN